MVFSPEDPIASATKASEQMSKTQAPAVAEIFRTSNVAGSAILPATNRALKTTGTESSLIFAEDVPEDHLSATKVVKTTINRTTTKDKRAGLPKVMEFYSSWTESGKKQQMVLKYFPESKTWNIKVEIPMPVEIYGRNGELLEPWDLHVGAKIDVLGRQVTLMQANLNTLNWLDCKAQALIKKKISLENELSKFTHIKLTQTVHTSQHQHLQSATPHHALGGKINLRGLKNEVEILKAKLEEYKPTPPPPDPEEEEGEQENEQPSEEAEE